MSDLDLRKLELDAQERREQREAQEKRSIRNGELFKWFVMLLVGLLNPLLNATMTAVQTRAISQVSEKADMAAVAASKAATVAVEAKHDQSEKLTAIVGGVDAGVKSWKAYQTKEPEDMHAAEEAISKAASIMP